MLYSIHSIGCPRTHICIDLNMYNLLGVHLYINIAIYKVPQHYAMNYPLVLYHWILCRSHHHILYDLFINYRLANVCYRGRVPRKKSMRPPIDPMSHATTYKHSRRESTLVSGSNTYTHTPTHNQTPETRFPGYLCVLIMHLMRRFLSTLAAGIGCCVGWI